MAAVRVVGSDVNWCFPGVVTGTAEATEWVTDYLVTATDGGVIHSCSCDSCFKLGIKLPNFDYFYCSEPPHSTKLNVRRQAIHSAVYLIIQTPNLINIPNYSNIMKT